MKKEKLKGLLTVTRPEYSDGREVIELTVHDNNSVNKFLTVHVDIKDFMRAITGHGRVPMVFETSKLQHVGKLREVKDLSFTLTGNLINRVEEARSKAHLYAEEGWEPDLYFGSRDSFVLRADGTVTAHTRQFRYVEHEE